MSDACEIWFEELTGKGKATATIQSYEDAMRLHVIPGVGALRVRQLTVGVADRFLASVRDTTGPSAAKHAKTVLGGVMGLATRHEAIDHNPIRDVSPISVEQKEARSLTIDEVRTLRAGLAADKKAIGRDVPMLVDFMLGTGMRIGEVLAVVWDALDRSRDRVDPGHGDPQVRRWLDHQTKPKTKSGWRTLHLPPWLVALLKARDRVDNQWDVVFPSQQGKLRERSNTNADLRDALDPLGFGWATSHNFRKTAATLLNDGGLAVREIADQLGHKRISVTQDTYLGRAQPSPKVAKLLDVVGSDAT